VYGGLNPRQLAVSPDGKSVYVVDIGQATVSQFDVGAGGALSPKSPPTVVAAGQGLAVNPDGKSVYVLHTSGFLSQFDVGAGGVLSPKSPATVATPATIVAALAVSPDGHSVYIAGNGIVAQYDVGAGGALSPKSPPTVAAPGAALGAVAVSPDGHSVYVSGAGPGLTGIVLQYDVGASGALTPKSPLTVPAGPPDLSFALAVSADGKSVYVASGTVTNNFSVSQYDVGVGGTLSPKSPATVAAGRGPAFGIAVTPLPRVPTSKDQCKNGGWHNFAQFRSQGDCVSLVERGPKG
jgi:DNA-binding beta-propeller fold protein YncE